MGGIETSIDIKAPREKIWEMLAFDRQPEWTDGLKDLTFTSEVQTPEDKYKVGTSAQTTMSGEGEVDFKITESQKNEKMVFSMKGSRTFVISTLLLKSVEEGTKLTYKTDYELPWGVLGKFLNKLFAQRMAEKEMEKSLENLKNILEK